jgi:formylglycine-generating enzyme required for sulfatase activity
MRGWLLCALFFCGIFMFGEVIEPVKGDLNNDGVVDATDTALLADYQAGNLDTVYEAGDFYQADSIVGVLRYVPAGTFEQGYNSDDPCNESNEIPFTHTLTKNLAVMTTEVTRYMWAALKNRQSTLPDDPTHVSTGGGMEHPVQMVKWIHAVLFANLLSLEQGLTRCYYTDADFTIPLTAQNYTVGNYYCDFDADGYRLPTEGEWEYFCRAGTTTLFSVPVPNFTECAAYCTPGDLPGLESVAWFCANYYDDVWNSTTKPVGIKNPNPWGFYDVHGNVKEWCWDLYENFYPEDSATDYRGGNSGTTRCQRGGWYYADADLCRSGSRYSGFQDNTSETTGFRLCRSLN